MKDVARDRIYRHHRCRRFEHSFLLATFSRSHACRNNADRSLTV
jgi:hypothetical protein